MNPGDEDRMRVLGEARGILLYAPEDAYLSFYNSPYVGHKTSKAVDIYPRHGEWNGSSYSPIDGTVSKIQLIKMGRGRGFPSADFDYGIGITPDGYDDIIVRILHTKPDVIEGDRVERGDCIGNILRSRYFNYWTGPHYHVEILPASDFSRSTQSFPMMPNISPLTETKSDEEQSSEYEIELSTIHEDYLIGFSQSIPYGMTNQMMGHLGFLDSSSSYGILDTGIPHYKIGGLHSVEVNFENVIFCDVIIGSSLNDGTLFSISKTISPHLDSNQLKGISFFLYPKCLANKGRPPIILIPNEQGQLVGSYQEGDVAILNMT